MITKPSNPKDVIGSGKLPLELVPESAIAEEAVAFFEGASKYGRYNWRVAGVRASIYMAACLRHLFKWWAGDERDKVTRVKHLASARACLGILIDAEWSGKLTDDRPPRQPEFERRVDELARDIEHLRQLYADKTPHQYTIADEATASELSLAIPQRGEARVRCRCGWQGVAKDLLFAPLVREAKCPSCMAAFEVVP